MHYKIGSFNMYKFSYQRNKDIAKNYGTLADIILGEQFDILALQEVFTPDAVELLVNRLGSGWKYAWNAPISKSIQAQEGYAFIWNSRKFRPATGMTKDERGLEDRPWQSHKQYDPRIHDNYRKDKVFWNGGLVRDPFYGRFESILGWIEIRLINTHIMFSDKSQNEDASINDVQKRQQELTQLIEIYKSLCDKQYRSRRPSYTFLLGDYNLNLRSSGAKSAFISEYTNFPDRNGKITKQILTVQNQLTTLKAKPAPHQDLADHKDSDFLEIDESQYFSNNYDHFTFDAVRFDGVNLSWDRVNSVYKYCENDPDKHRREISDHVPIYICMG